MYFTTRDKSKLKRLGKDIDIPLGAVASVTATLPAVSVGTQNPDISLRNDSAATITEVDTGTLASSDTRIPTSKSVVTAIGVHTALITGVHGLVISASQTLTVEASSVLNQDLTSDASPTFVTAKLSGLTDDYIPYHVNDTTGLANGPTKTNVDSAVTLKHAAVTVSAPISLSTQAISLVNDAAATVTEIDTGILASSDTKIPTSKSVVTAIAASAVQVVADAAARAALTIAAGALVLQLDDSGTYICLSV